MAFQFKSGLILITSVILAWSSRSAGQSTPATPGPGTEQHGPEQHGIEQPPDQPLLGNLSGTIVDQTGAVVTAAEVKLTGDDPSLSQQALTGADGQFSFANVPPGSFQLTVTSAGFGAQTFSGTLHPGENEALPPIVLSVATNVTEVQVGVSQVEVAEEQIKVEEHQRVLGAIPNFYVSYVPNAAPLTPKQKFELAVKSVVDPFSFAVVAGTAGVQQAQNHFRDYGQGVQGYAKRFGANYADTVTGTFIGGAILPSILKQDPRYFYKGTGSKGSRALYAIAMAVVCKGDNGRWQPNYSGLLGSLAAGGISNLYYPEQDRDGLGLTLDNTAIGIGATAITNVLQEFVIRRFTPKPKHDPTTP